MTDVHRTYMFEFREKNSLVQSKLLLKVLYVYETSRPWIVFTRRVYTLLFSVVLRLIRLPIRIRRLINGVKKTEYKLLLFKFWNMYCLGYVHTIPDRLLLRFKTCPGTV